MGQITSRRIRRYSVNTLDWLGALEALNRLKVGISDIIAPVVDYNRELRRNKIAYVTYDAHMSCEFGASFEQNPATSSLTRPVTAEVS